MSDAIETAERFTGLAEAYDRYRPRYPSAAIAAVLADLPVPADVVDVGAGTGISTRALVDAGARTIAIEPNAEMRAVALAHGLDAREGSADRTRLPDASADVVAVFQAFHWFTNAAAIAEFARLMRPGGRLALVWNERDTRGDPFTAKVREIERRYAEDGKLAGGDFYDDALATLLGEGGFPRVRRLQFGNDQRLDRDGLRGRIFSTTYMSRTGSRLHDIVAALDELYDRYADRSGHVTLVYRTDVIIGER